MNKLIFIIPILLSGCMFIMPIKPNDISLQLVENWQEVGYKIQSECLEHDVQILANCASDPQTYTFSFRNKENNKIANGAQWSFFTNGGYNISSLNLYDENEYLSLITNIQVAKFRGSKIDITFPELTSLPELCKNKYAKRQEERSQRRKAIMEKDAKLVASVKKSTGLEPMFSGNNQKTFNFVVSNFQKHGFSQHKNKFVWLDDGDYRVSQVLEGRVMLTSYSNYLPPITIITSLPAMEGQWWSKVTRAPLKFIGVKNYKTVLGVGKQTVVFEQL